MLYRYGPLALQLRQQCDTHEYNDTRNGAAFVLA